MKKTNTILVAIIALSTALFSCKKETTQPPAAPTASFSWQASSITAPATVTFSNTSTNATSYAWSFGDATTSTDATPTHIYTAAGNYTITLTATGAGGTTSTTATISIALAPTELKALVTDDLSNALPNASVTIYPSQADYDNNTNIVTTTTTDANGYLYLSSATSNIVAGVIYYFNMSSGCKNNYNAANHFASPLVANTLNVYNNIVLTSKGTIKVVNTSSNPYKIYIDGVVVNASLAGNSAHIYPQYLLGNHTVRVLQLSGYVFTPTDKTFTATVSC